MSTETLATSTPTTEDFAPASTTRISTFWRRIDSLLESASEYLNPILVKETRQALKSQQFVLWFLLLLAACWIVTVGGIAWIGPGVEYAASGGVLFLAYYAVLVVALVVVVPFAAFRSLAAEQEDNTRDVLMVSALSPRQVVNGKIGSALLQMMVYLSALAPCLVFTYLLRGIDLLAIVLLPSLAVLASLGLSMLGLLLASAVRQRYSQVLISVGLVAILLLAALSCFSAASEVVGRSTLIFQQTEFWVFTGAMLTFYGCGMLLTYFGAAACNAFASANRSTALRRILFLTQGCFVGWISVAWLVFERDAEALEYAAAISWVYWGFAGAILTGEQPILSERVRRGLPVSIVGRMLGTWFNPGPGTGYLFVVSNVATLVVLLITGILISDRRSEPVEVEIGLVLLGATYTIGFLGVGRLIIAGVRRLAPLSLLGCFLIQLLLLLACSGLPELLRSSFTRYGRLSFTWYDTLSPLRTLNSLWDGDINLLEMQTLLVIVMGVAACVLLINLLLAAREIQQTWAPLPQRVIEDEQELHPVQATVTSPWGDVSPSA